MRKFLKKVITSITAFSLAVVGSSFVSTPFSIEGTSAAEATIDLSKLDQEKLYGTYEFERMDLYNKFDHQLTRQNVYYRNYSIDGKTIYNVQPQVIVNGTVKIHDIYKYIKEGQSVLNMVVKMKPKGDWKNQDVVKEVSIDIPADYLKRFKATLGDKEVNKGDYVTLGGFMWRVMGDNYLLHDGVTYKGGTFSNSANGVFSPKNPGSIGHYLNNDFLDSFPDEDKAYLENHRWEIRTDNGDLITATRAYIGMPSLQDFKDYPITMGRGVTNGNVYNYGIMSPIAPLYGTWTVRVDMSDENIAGLPAKEKFDVKATTHLKSNVKITGEGTKENPYKITGVGVSINAPNNLRVTSATDHFVDIVWEGVPNATYTLKANGSVIYTGEATSYKYMTNAPNTEYKFTLTASNGKETSDPVEVVGKTLEQQTVPNPNNLKLVSISKDKLSISWDKVDNAGIYRIKLNGEVKYNGNQTQVDFQGLKSDTEYTIELVAIGLDGNTESSPSTMNIKTDKDEEIGEVPSKPKNFYAGKVQPHSITLRWSQSEGAEEYVMTRDNDLVVYSGKTTIFRDENVDPNQVYKYVLIAKNKYGVSTSVDYEVKTPEDKKVQLPTSPEVGPTTVSFDFKEVAGAKGYGIDRNPSWTYKPNGDGTYHVNYVNTVTGEKRDLGNMKLNDSGKIPFIEDGLEAGKNYHYSVIAYLEDGPNGEVMTTEPTEVVVTTPINPVPGKEEGTTDPTPAPGEETTAPSTPGTGGGSTTAPSTPGTGGGSTTAPSTPGTGGGSTTAPSTPGTGGGSTTAPSTPGTGGGSTTAPSTPGTGGGSTTAPSTPGTGGGSTTAPSTPGTGGGSTTAPSTPGTG
ncbi:fibronectin type III domain-containing protein, partial [Brevibacillus halotolerans]|uniref:fibronectin type III domain-containing protein n=1 Tax=Brevibacillus halotolerans TaxID=1507437 RepID=UPI0015EF6421